MRYLVDTNVLLRSIEASHPMNAITVNAIQSLLSRGEDLCIMPQNLIEFWAVATRPTSVNGLGLPFAEALMELSELKLIFTLQPDTSDIFAEWENLLVHHQVIGKQVHDTRLVAAMRVHRITHLLTFNVNDFKRFSEITTIDIRDL